MMQELPCDCLTVVTGTKAVIELPHTALVITGFGAV